MIPRAYIDAWRATVPWQQDAQVEQGLVISRALVQIFSHELLREHLAFRGGTALHKLFIQPQARYSEDLDLVHMNYSEAEPLGYLFDFKLWFFRPGELGNKTTLSLNANLHLQLLISSQLYCVTRMKSLSTIHLLLVLLHQN